MFNSPTRPGFSKFPRPMSNLYKEKMSAPNNAYYVLTQAHAGLPNSVLFDDEFAAKSTTDLIEGTNFYYTDARVGVYGDAAYLKLDGSNANSNINVGTYNITTTGNISCSQGIFSTGLYPSSDNNVDLGSSALRFKKAFLYNARLEGVDFASRFLRVNAFKDIISADLDGFIEGTANQVIVEEADLGGITLSTPQDIHIGASPTFAALTATGTIQADRLEANTDALFGGTLGIQSGQIVDTGGTIDFDNENLTTTGTGTFGIVNVTDEDTGFQIDGTSIMWTGNPADFNMFLGKGAFTNDEGEKNVGIGFEAGYNNETTGGVAYGDVNVYIGYAAGYGKTTGTPNTGYKNIAIGGFALYRNTSGNNNSALGQNALINNTTGYQNAAIGSDALYTNKTGYRNLALGFKALNKSTSNYNTAIGGYAGYKTSLGNYNTFIGALTGYNITTGLKNVFLGTQAGYRQTGSNILIIDNQDRGSEVNEAAKCLIYGVFDADETLQTLRFNAGISSSTKTITASADDTDVTGVNTVFINITGDIVLGGLTGGVNGQVVHFTIIGNFTNKCTFEQTEGVSDQDFVLHTEADESIDSGGMTFVCNGSNWYDVSHARHV